MIGKKAVCVALVAGMMALSAPAHADSGGCMVMTASKAALQRRLAEIDAAKVNANSFFSGASSCISPNLFSGIDLSQIIPDVAGLMNGGMQTIVQKLLDAAKQQVCQIVQYQIQSVVQKINSELGEYYSSDIGSDVSNLMGQYASVDVPSITGFGSYTLTSPSVSEVVPTTTVGNVTNSLTNTVTNAVTSSSSSSSSSSNSSSSSSSPLSSIFN